MANTLCIKRSSTTTAVPTTLLEGELAANIIDKKVWIGDSSQTPVLISDYNNAGGSETPILENLQTISTSKTLTAASNGISLGPITINTSVNVNLSNGQRWIIL